MLNQSKLEEKMKRWSLLWKVLAVQLLLVFALAGASQAAGKAAYIRGQWQPWGQSTNEAAMTTVFGEGGWSDLRMADGAGPFLPASGYNVIFLEGSEGTDYDLNAYLTANLPAIEAWVQNGGRLLLNSAPWDIGMDFGFGGVVLTYDEGSAISDAVATNPSHPIFLGPYLPVGTSFSGGSFSHATVAGPGLVPLINDLYNVDAIALAELQYGSGVVLFGGMTTTNFHDPQPQAFNLRANILSYLNVVAAQSPTSLSVTPRYPLSTDYVNLRWGASPSTGVTYEVERSVNGGRFVNVYAGSLTAVRFRAAMLPRGQHVYRVRAVGSAYAPSAWRTASPIVVR
jgi:hypothetical protein